MTSVRSLADTCLERMTRRTWLRRMGRRFGGVACGWMGVAGSVGGSRNLAAEAPVPAWPGFGRAKSVVLIYASGGQSQIDTWDPKPAAPDTVRGEFAPIPTAVPGLTICEHLPRVARIADRLTVVRSMSHEDLDHGSATHLALTGRYHRQLSSNPDPSPDDFPTYGAVLKRVEQPGRTWFDAVHVNGPALVPFTPAPGQFGGLLGRDFDPLVLGDVSQASVAVPGLSPLPDLKLARLDQRRGLKATLDAGSAQLGQSPDAAHLGHLYGEAWEVLSAPRFREAFDLDREPPAVRDRYGRHRSGQACLLARRLVEASVPLITVIWNHSNRGQDKFSETDSYGWDTHNDIFTALQQHLLPRFDESFSALIEDLDQRGLLAETLVVCMGEFGRAPRIAIEPAFAGARPGRKHWSSVYSAVFAGAGVTRGAVLGESDRMGGEPKSERYGPWDAAATMYSALGIDPWGHFLDALQRPFPICIGRPMERLYSA